ncbi:MAG: hypothetical protein ACR2Q4_23270, partial [Geminicoccaceae bacterium]
DTGGWIWHSVDGRTWTRRHGFDSGRGIELSSYRGRLFLGGTDDTRGIGLLWGLPGRPTPTAGETTASRSGLPEGLPHLDHQTDWTAAGAELDRKLADPAMYQDHGRRLRDALFGLMAKKPPAGFLTKRLHAEMPEQPLSLIGGAVQVPSVLMGRALLLWGISRLGEAELAAGDRIPLVFLKESWNRPSNRAEKYFDTLPFALWAIASTGQDDKATINTLIERLDQPDDPLWLRGDVVGALSALTRERFGYDVAAWQRWWTSASTVWP